MVELIILLHEVVDVVRDDCRAIGASCFLYDVCIFSDLSDELLLLGGDGKPCEGRGESDTQLLCFTKEAADTSVGVLDKGACVPVEVNTLLGVEGHVLARVNLEDEVLQRAQTYTASDFGGFFSGHILALTLLFGDGSCCSDHLVHKVIGIDDRTFTALHLAVGELDHTIAEVHEPLTEGIAQAIK